VGLLLLLTLLVATPAPAAAQGILLPTSESIDDDDGADVIGAFKDSMKLLLLEHGTRVAFQEKTRRELGGNFWRDYQRSVRIPNQWGDTDSWAINDVGHTIHGAAAAHIWLNHDRKAPVVIHNDARYWASRARAMAWAAAFSAQFEIGPFSEASIGNVGMRPETTGWVDHVVTPVGAFGMVVAEDALDRYFVRWFENRVENRVARVLIRMAANPGRTLSNTSSGRLPWHRSGRPVTGQ